MRRFDGGAIRAGAVILTVTASVTLTGIGTTFAAYSDFSDMPGAAGAGVWAPDPPAACDEVLGKPHATIWWGSPGDDVFYGGNYPQVIMGMGGNDTLYAGNSGDCLVGGDGDDRLYGHNAKDVILGGAGNDYLDGGNGKDGLDGGDGDADVCLGGNGKDTVVNCEYTAPPIAPLLAPTMQQEQDEPQSAQDARDAGGEHQPSDDPQQKPPVEDGESPDGPAQSLPEHALDAPATETEPVAPLPGEQ